MTLKTKETTFTENTPIDKAALNVIARMREAVEQEKNPDNIQAIRHFYEKFDRISNARAQGVILSTAINELENSLYTVPEAIARAAVHFLAAIFLGAILGFVGLVAGTPLFFAGGNILGAGIGASIGVGLSVPVSEKLLKQFSLFPVKEELQNFCQQLDSVLSYS